MATTRTPPSSQPGPTKQRQRIPDRTGNRRKNSGKRQPKKQNPFWFGLKVIIQAVLILVCVAILSLMFFLYAALSKAPSSIDLTFYPPGITNIYASDGTPLARLFVENRQVAPIEQIPIDLQNATVAFEDKRFYQHSGVDFVGILRALGKNIKSGDMKGEGGSTITQQLARNMGIQGLTREKSIQRKLHEWIVATQIEKSYTKQQILWMYLNQVNYGQGAYGVESAAKTYFGKDVDKLDLAQCALLSGLPNRPTYFNPYKDKDAAKIQRDIVLDNMRAQGFITAAQCTSAKAEYIHLAAPTPPVQGSQIFHAPYFVNYVVDQLRRKYGSKALALGNMNVQTTLNMQMQKIAENTLRSGIASSSDRGPNQGAIVALDPISGAIRAMVGGVDYKDNQVNLATQARRQPGSSFKAVVYAAAIDSGAVSGENMPVYDGPITFKSGGESWTPRDDNGYSYNNYTLRSAMAYSVNVVAVKVLKLIGPDEAIRYAHLMGVNDDTPLAPVLSLALGSSAVTPLEMADVYATIASGGNHPVPSAITLISDASNKTIEDLPPEVETHVLKPDTAKQLDDMLRAVVTDPKGTGAGAADVPDARGKTGTTQGHKDVWFIGYTPQLVCAVWAGHPARNAKTGIYSYGEEMEGNAWGSTVCVPIWKNFMLQAVPIYKDVLAREAARDKPVVAPKPITPEESKNAIVQDQSADGSTYVYRHHRQHRQYSTDNFDNGVTSGGDSVDPNANPNDLSNATDNSDGSRSATVDNTTGLLAPAGSPNSHRETFSSGTAPTVLSPKYSDAQHYLSHGDETSTPDVARPQIDLHHERSDTPSENTTLQPKTGEPTFTVKRAHDSSTTPDQDQYVTVRINPEDGKLATKWTPQYVERHYRKGTEPHDYSHMYGPPPGEH